MRSPKLSPALVVVLFISWGTPVRAQLISLKTVPLATGEQFQLYPADRVGVGALSIALPDTLRDPVASPATGAWLDGVYLFGAPVVYDYDGREGGGLTLPLGAFGSAGRWFGGLAGAVQEAQPVRVAAPSSSSFAWPDAAYAAVLPPEARSDSRLNNYVFVLAGRRLGERDAVALSASHAWLRAVQGVEQLYDGAAAIVQDGRLLDLRLGYMHAYDDGGSLDVVLLRNALDMTHDVAWLNNVAAGPVAPLPVFSWDHNADRTRTWGAYARYMRPLNDVWHAGVVVAVNRKSHPKIPNYQIMSIPRDPGTSTALSVGVGTVYEAGGMVVGADLLLEPGWTMTWATADAPVTVQDSLVLLQAGERAVENHFRFMNGIVRVAAGRQLDRLDLGAGLEMRSIGYHMTQYRFAEPWWLRRQDERWIEWTPTWGAALRLPGFQLRYDGRVTFGSGAHHSFAWVTPANAAVALDGVDFIPAPSMPLNFDYLTVWTHQISVSLSRPRR